MTKTVACPVCKGPATITLVEQPDRFGATEGHSIEFACADSAHDLDEVQKLKLWAADRSANLQDR